MKLSAVISFQPNSASNASPSEPAMALPTLAISVCMEKVMPLASVPVLNLPYSAQSGVNMNSSTPVTAVNSVLSTDRPIYAPTLPRAKKKMSRLTPIEQNRQTLYMVILFTFLMRYGTAKDATA